MMSAGAAIGGERGGERHLCAAPQPSHSRETHPHTGDWTRGPKGANETFSHHGVALPQLNYFT